MAGAPGVCGKCPQGTRDGRAGPAADASVCWDPSGVGLLVLKAPGLGDAVHTARHC